VQKQQDAEEKARVKARAQSARRAADAVDRFFEQFWAPVRKEQRSMERAAKKKR
jgi:hypothetical protein